LALERPLGGRGMDDGERRKRLHGELLEKRCQPFPFVVRRREVTADFDQRQKQCFNEALIAILIADLPPEKIEQVLVAARDTTIQVFSGEMLADTRIASEKRESVDDSSHLSATDPLAPACGFAPESSSCIACNGHKLVERGGFIRCDDCGAMQPSVEAPPIWVQIAWRHYQNNSFDNRRVWVALESASRETWEVVVAVACTLMCARCAAGSPLDYREGIYRHALPNNGTSYALVECRADSLRRTLKGTRTFKR